jgi:hypothetical protein
MQEQPPIAPPANAAQMPAPTSIVYQPPQSTLEVINDPNRSNEEPSTLQWLTEELFTEINLWKPKVADDDAADIFLQDGIVKNTNRLSDAFSSVFFPGRKFYNIYQAQAMAQELAHHWGFHLRIEGGTQFVCAYGGRDRKKDYKSVVSPSKRRNRNEPIKKTGCMFKIVTGFVPNELQKSAKRQKIIKSYDRKKTTVQVILGGSVYHNHPVGKSSLILAKKTAGAYSINKLPRPLVETLISVVAFASGPPTQIRGIIRQFVPEDLDISDNDIRNFRNMARGAYLRGEV